MVTTADVRAFLLEELAEFMDYVDPETGEFDAEDPGAFYVEGYLTSPSTTNGVSQQENGVWQHRYGNVVVTEKEL